MEALEFSTFLSSKFESFADVLAGKRFHKRLFSRLVGFNSFSLAMGPNWCLALAAGGHHSWPSEGTAGIEVPGTRSPGTT